MNYAIYVVYERDEKDRKIEKEVDRLAEICIEEKRVWIEKARGEERNRELGRERKALENQR